MNLIKSFLAYDLMVRIHIRPQENGVKSREPPKRPCRREQAGRRSLWSGT